MLDDLREIKEEKKKNKDERDAKKRATLKACDKLLLGLKRRQTIQLDNNDKYNMPSSLVSQKRQRKESCSFVIIHRFEKSKGNMTTNND